MALCDLLFLDRLEELASLVEVEHLPEGFFVGVALVERVNQK